MLRWNIVLRCTCLYRLSLLDRRTKKMATHLVLQAARRLGITAVYLGYRYQYVRRLRWGYIACGLNNRGWCRQHLPQTQSKANHVGVQVSDTHHTAVVASRPLYMEKDNDRRHLPPKYSSSTVRG